MELEQKFYPLPHLHTEQDYDDALSEIFRLRKIVDELNQQTTKKKKSTRKQNYDFLPLPIKFDASGRSMKAYSLEDWFLKIMEEFLKAHLACKENLNFKAGDFYPTVERSGTGVLAEKLTDIITLCTTFLETLGFDQKARAELQRRVNEKNHSKEC